MMFPCSHRFTAARILVACSIAAASLSLLGAETARAAEPVLGIADPLQLHYGVNEIAGFLPDGRAATIVMAHRDNGNAHGYDVYLVYAPDSKAGGKTPAVPGIIDVEPAAGVGATADTIRDEPFDGEAEIGALRFVREWVGGRSSIVLVQARRQVGTVTHLTDPAPVELTVWRLDGPSDLAGRTTYVFLVASRSVTARRYCNATSALRTEFGIAYPDGWDGASGPDGCASDAEVSRNASGLQMLRTLDVTSFDNSTRPRRRPGQVTLADYGFARTESFDDGWAYASQVDGSWTIGVLVLDENLDRKLLCVTDAARGEGTYRSTAVVEVVPTKNGLWRATDRVVTRPDCVKR